MTVARAKSSVPAPKLTNFNWFRLGPPDVEKDEGNAVVYQLVPAYSDNWNYIGIFHPSGPVPTRWPGAPTFRHYTSGPHKEGDPLESLLLQWRNKTPSAFNPRCCLTRCTFSLRFCTINEIAGLRFTVYVRDELVSLEFRYYYKRSRLLRGIQKVIISITLADKKKFQCSKKFYQHLLEIQISPLNSPRNSGITNLFDSGKNSINR